MYVRDVVVFFFFFFFCLMKSINYTSSNRPWCAHFGAVYSPLLTAPVTSGSAAQVEYFPPLISLILFSVFRSRILLSPDEDRSVMAHKQFFQGISIG